MKKILLCVPLLAIFAAGFFGCSQQRQWNHEQRKGDARGAAQLPPDGVPRRPERRRVRALLRRSGRAARKQLSRLHGVRPDAGRRRHGGHGGRLDDRRRTERRRPQHAAHLPLQLPRSAGRAARRATTSSRKPFTTASRRRSMRRTPRWTSSSTPFWPTRATCRRSAGWRASVRTTFSAGW